MRFPRLPRSADEWAVIRQDAKALAWIIYYVVAGALITQVVGWLIRPR